MLLSSSGHNYPYKLQHMAGESPENRALRRAQPMNAAQKRKVQEAINL